MIWLLTIAGLLMLLLFSFYAWYRNSGLGQYYKYNQILLLHAISEKFDFSISRLSRRQLAGFLEKSTESNLKISALPDFCEQLSAQAHSPALCLTFDDGYEELYDLYFKLFEPAQIPVTIFLTAGFLGRPAEWDYKPRKSRHLSLEQARELSRHKLITLGSHSMTHPDLTRISHLRGVEEIAGSKEFLEDSLGCAISYFSYPFGRYNSAIISTVAQAGYLAAFCGVPAHLNGEHNIFALPRIPLNLLDNLFTFNQKTGVGCLAWMEFSRARVIELFSGLTHQVRRTS